MTIRFGTDGWRGIIAEEFTFPTLRKVAHASAEVLAQTYPGTGIYIGYDNRFLAPEFAQAVADTLVEAGFEVFLATCAAPTPAISWVVKALGGIGGLVLTASHNPAAYCGLKIKAAFGGSAPETVTQAVEELLEKDHLPPRPGGTLTHFDPWELYIAEIKTKVDLTTLQTLPMPVYLDGMHGSGSSGFDRLGLNIGKIRAERDPLFGGFSPEPIAKNLTPAFKLLKGLSEEATVIVFDGDADRIAAVNGDGTYLNCQVLIPLLIDHLARRRGQSGAVVKTLSGSDLIRRVAVARGLKVYETAIGFKYIAEIMEREPVILGGEESGGIGYQDYMPERDALLSGLYLLEILVATGKSLLANYNDLCDELDFHPVYDRIDITLPSAEFKAKLIERLAQSPPTEVCGRPVIEHLTTDGHKFVLDDNRWLLIRFSGTEPLLRLYCEGGNHPQVAETLQWAKAWAVPSV